MSDDGKDKEMICGLTADERDRLHWQLNALPGAMPRREVWLRIREQAEAEGLFRGRRRIGWQGGLAMAATVALAVVLVPQLGQRPDATTEPAAKESEPLVPVPALHTLMVESRQLEDNLRALPAEPRVVRAGTAATISDLEDRIAAIDFQLNDPDVTMTSEEEEIFWRERVRLMKLLVRLRYAQAQRSAI